MSFRDEFVVEPLPNLENDTEAIWAKVLLPGEKALYVSSFYRPPKSGSEPLEKLEGVLESIIDKPDNKHLILGGDFNCPSIDWQNLSVRPGGAEPAAQNKLLDIHNKFAISQVQMEPARGENNLDLFFTTNPSLVKNSTVVPGIYDHDMVVTDCELRPIYNRPKPRKTFQFSKANWDKIECATKKFRSAFEKTFSQNTVETNWCLFRDVVHSTIQDVVPLKNKTTRYNLPLLTPKIKHLVRKKHRSYDKAKKSGLDSDWQACK